MQLPLFSSARGPISSQLLAAEEDGEVVKHNDGQEGNVGNDEGGAVGGPPWV